MGEHAVMRAQSNRVYFGRDASTFIPGPNIRAAWYHNRRNALEESTQRGDGNSVSNFGGSSVAMLTPFKHGAITY